MIKIKLAEKNDYEVLALLGRVTWSESHGHYIPNRQSLNTYLDTNFSIAQTKIILNNPNNVIHIIYVDNLPVGYAKTVLHEKQENITSNNICKLERIFIQKDFIPLKIGKVLLSFVEKEIKALGLDTIWLSVYIKNERAIRFYEKNNFKNVGNLNFHVDGRAYDNIVFSKNL